MQKLSFHPSERFIERVVTLLSEQMERIQAVAPYASITHIGSSAIPGALTKGDVDVNVRVESQHFTSTVKALQQLYQINQPENWTEQYASFKDYKSLELPFGVQLTVIGSPDDVFVQHLMLLKQNPDLLDQYNNLKRSFEGGDIDQYRKARMAFFNDMCMNAGLRS